MKNIQIMHNVLIKNNSMCTFKICGKVLKIMCKLCLKICIGKFNFFGTILLHLSWPCIKKTLTQFIIYLMRSKLLGMRKRKFNFLSFSAAFRYYETLLFHTLDKTKCSGILLCFSVHEPL